MIFSQQNVPDIKKYYDGTYIKIPHTGDTVWYIKQIRSDEIEVEDVNGITCYLDLTEPFEVDYPLPHRTVYQHHSGAACLVRIPAKQYYRGISTKNTAIYICNSAGAWKAISLRFDTIQGFVDKPAYQDPYLLETSLEKSVALNRFLSLDQKGNLFILMTPIGKYDFKSGEITCEKLFAPEVSKVFYKSKVNVY